MVGDNRLDGKYFLVPLIHVKIVNCTIIDFIGVGVTKNWAGG